MAEMECPYCEEIIEVQQDDGFGYEENVLHETQCEKCEKFFVFSTQISFNYSPERADCLNEGGEHDWKPSRTYPKELSVMRCSMCDCEREPTTEEWDTIFNRSRKAEHIGEEIGTN